MIHRPGNSYKLLFPLGHRLKPLVKTVGDMAALRPHSQKILAGIGDERVAILWVGRVHAEDAVTVRIVANNCNEMALRIGVNGARKLAAHADNSGDIPLEVIVDGLKCVTAIDIDAPALSQTA
jgi:hypothetical protein